MEWHKLTQRQKKRIRSRARNFTKELVQEQSNSCLYCGRFIVSIQWLTDNKITFHKVKNNKVVYDLCENRVIASIATVEHIRDLSQGGSNEKRNLCATCTRCNNRKAERKHRDQNNSYKGKGTMICHRCEGPKEHERLKWKTCLSCKEYVSKKWFSAKNHFNNRGQFDETDFIKSSQIRGSKVNC